MKKRLFGLMLLLCLMTSAALADQTAVIDAGDSTKLHLRAQASSSADSLGLFFTGTRVNCLARSGGWTKVQVGADVGYMDSRYLQTQGTVEPRQPRGWIVAKNGANMRSGPDTGYEQLKTLGYGTAVTILGETDEHWYYVSADGKDGYVSKKLVSLNSPDAAEGFMVIDGGNSTKVHLRQDASQSSDSLGLYFTGTSAERLHTRGEWTYVRIGEEEGYMMSKYLRTGRDANYVIHKQPLGYVSAKNGANMRSGPSTEYSHRRTLGYGEAVTIQGETVDHWYFISAGGQEGYVSAKLISLDTMPQRPNVPQKPGRPMPTSVPQTPSAVLPQNLPQNWLFSSGAGAWGTEIYLNKDGTFTGVYGDSDGDIHYESVFSGRFVNVRQLDALTYTMTIDQLTIQGELGSSYWKDGQNHIIAEPAGLKAGETFTLHLPGTPITDWSDWKKGWMHSGRENAVLTDFYLWGQTSESGFVPSGR